MGIRELLGEVGGKDIIDLGDIVTVKFGKNDEIYGRLNATSKKEIKVGMIRIKIENITDIQKER